jgi:proteasome beta subunit
MRETPNELVMKGTTTIGIVCQDGVILASDTRVTMGFFVAHHKGKKIYQIDEHLAMTIAGNVSDAQKAVDILKANAQLYRLNYERLMPVNTAARVLANLLFSVRYAPLGVQALVGGVDNTGAHVYAIDPLGSVTEERCVSTGSGSPIAYGILEDKYSEDAKIKEFSPIVVKAVKAAMKRDVGSGDSFDIVIIDENGYRELGDEEKERIAAGS